MQDRLTLDQRHPWFSHFQQHLRSLHGHFPLQSAAVFPVETSHFSPLLHLIRTRQTVLVPPLVGSPTLPLVGFHSPLVNSLSLEIFFKQNACFILTNQLLV